MNTLASRRRSTCAASVALLLLFAPTVAAAQRIASSVDLTGMSMQYQDSLNVSGASVSPAVRAEWALGTIALSGTYSSRGAAGSTQEGFVAASVFTPSWNSLRAEGATTLNGVAYAAGGQTGRAMTTGRAHLMAARQGVWAGFGVGQSWNGAVWSPLRTLEAALWIQRSGLTAIITGTPTSVADTTRYTDVQLAARWMASRVELGASASTRSGLRGASVRDGVQTWGSVSVTAWLASRVALVASGGSYPADQALSYPGGTIGTLGLRLASHRNDAVTEREAAQADLLAWRSTKHPAGISSFMVSPSARGERTIRVHAPRARRVEVTADFTRWHVVPLLASGNGWWSITLPITPGTYEVEVRVDGGRWTVPPGLTPVKDEFGELRGLLVISQ